MKHTPKQLINIARSMYAIALSGRDYTNIRFDRIDGDFFASVSNSDVPIHIDPTISDPATVAQQLPRPEDDDPAPIWGHNLQTRRRLALALACAFASIQRAHADTISVTRKSVHVYSYDAELDAFRSILLQADKLCTPTARQEIRNPYTGAMLGNLELTLYKTITA